MIQFKIQPGKDLTAFRRDLRTWRGRMRDLRWAWPEAARKIEAHHLIVFNSEGADNEAGVGAWTPLHDLTIRARLYGWGVSPVPPRDYLPDSDEGPEGRILHWSLRLRSSMGHGAGLFHDAIRRFTKRAFEYGTRTPYAYEHQWGGRSSQGYRLPARPFLDYEAGPELGIQAVERQLFALMGAV